MGGGQLFSKEEAGGLDDDVGIHFVPLQIGRILLGGQADLVAVDNHVVAFDLDVAFELAVNRIILQHVSEILGVEQVVDADNLDILVEVLHRGTEDHAADAAETVDTDFDHFGNSFFLV